MSNHDTNRIATELSIDPARQYLVPILLSALPGPAMIYYGEEIGMPGQKGGPPHWDSYRRAPFDWYSSEGGAGQTTWFKPEDRQNRPNDGISVEEEEVNSQSLLNAYRKYMALSSTQPALVEGEIILPEYQASGPGVWGFIRSTSEDFVIILVNFSSEDRDITLPDFQYTATALLDLVSGVNYPGVEKGQALSITLAAGKAVMLSGE
jgi:glycosidase